MAYRNAPNGDKPGSYQIATRAGKTTINPGDTLEFEQYITGYGQIRTAKIQAYISTDSIDLKASYILNSLAVEEIDNRIEISWGSQKDMLSDTGFTCLMAGYQEFGDDESTMVFDHNQKTKDPTLLCEKKVKHAPFEYHLKTKSNLSPGEHYMDFYLTYYNGEKWVTSKERVTFKIRNIFERFAKSISALAVIASVSGIVRFAIYPLYEAIRTTL